MSVSQYRNPASESASVSLTVTGDFVGSTIFAPGQNINGRTEATASFKDVVKISSKNQEEIWTPWFEIKNDSALTGGRSYTSSYPGYPQYTRTLWKDGECTASGDCQAINVPVVYSLSVDAGNSTPAGCTGIYPGQLYWDGTYHDDPNGTFDSNTGKVMQVPNTTHLAPDTKHYAAVITAKVTLPDEIPAKPSIAVKARRIRRVNGVLTLANDAIKSITLNLVTQSNNGKPVHNTQDPNNPTTTYTYRTHDLDDTEMVPNRVRGSADQVIDDWKGRWQFYIEGEICNRAELKVDKRSQLVNYAMDWVGFWPYRSTGSHDTDPAKLNVYHTPSGDLFVDCGSFIDHIYAKHGLSGNRNAPDSGAGAMRTFSGHFGLIKDSNTIINNNNPQYTQMTTIQSVLNQIFGTNYSAPPYWGVTVDSMSMEPDVALTNGQSDFTVPDAAVPATPSGPASLLKSLDNE